MSSINTEVGIYKRKILRKKKHAFDKEKISFKKNKRKITRFQPRKK